jgi:hypothetical protein
MAPLHMSVSIPGIGITNAKVCGNNFYWLAFRLFTFAFTIRRVDSLCSYTLKINEESKQEGLLLKFFILDIHNPSKRKFVYAVFSLITVDTTLHYI